jgi:hypothetical protein
VVEIVSHFEFRNRDFGEMTRWWREDDPRDRAEAIFAAYQWLFNHESERRQRLIRFSSLYAGRPIGGLEAEHFGNPEVLTHLERATPTTNLVHSVVDTAQAKIGVSRPRPFVLTEKGGSHLQLKAKRLDQFLWGLFHLTGAAAWRQLQLRDALIWGTGAIRVTEHAAGDHGVIQLERTYPWELLFDPLESHYGAPRSLIQWRTIDREVLAEKFPEHADDIRDDSITPRAADDAGDNRDILADQVVVAEAWRLPSFKGADDGHHAIATEHLLLTEVNRKWVSERFPFSFLHWSRPQTGFWGNSIVEQIEGLQIENNEMGLKISDILYHVAVPWILIEHNSEVEEGHIANDVKGIKIKYRGTPPQVVAHQAVNPDLYVQQDRTHARAFEMPGVSQLDATAKKPSGLNSGIAIREFEDLTAGRLGIHAQQYENGAIDLAELLIDSAKRLDSQGTMVEVAAEERKRRRSFIRRIKWKDVDFGADVFQLKLFPTSALPNHPGGQLAKIEEMIQAGMLDRESAMSLLDFPDLEAVVSLETAPRDLIMDVIDKILEDKVYTPPEPNMPLDMALRLVGLAYNRALLDGADEEALALLRDWQLQAEALRDQAIRAAQQAELAAQQAAAVPPPGAVPPGAEVPPAGQPGNGADILPDGVV